MVVIIITAIYIEFVINYANYYSPYYYYCFIDKEYIQVYIIQAMAINYFINFIINIASFAHFNISYYNFNSNCFVINYYIYHNCFNCSFSKIK